MLLSFNMSELNIEQRLTWWMVVCMGYILWNDVSGLVDHNGPAVKLALLLM